MTFNDYTHQWFAELGDHAKTESYPALEKLLFAVRKFPSKRNMLQARALVDKLRGGSNRVKLAKQFTALENREFRGEFRFTYHTYPKFGGQASACGELFSLIRQSIEYYR